SRILLSSTSSLIDVILDDDSTFNIIDSTINAPNNQRYVSFRIDDDPVDLIFKNVKFSSLYTNTDAKIAQIYGIEINPVAVFDHCTIPDITSYHPLLQIPGQSITNEFDDLLYKDKWSNLGQFNQIPSDLSNPLIVNIKIAYIGARHVFQTKATGYLNVVDGGDLTVHGVTFVQQAEWASIIQVNSDNAVVALEDVGFLVASQKLFESGIDIITSSKLREDFSKLKKSDNKINIDYYLRSLEKTSASEILVNPFVSLVSGYSISLSDIKFGDWIASGDKPLFDIAGPVQYATINNVQVSRVGRQYGGPHILNINLRLTGEAKITNVVIDGRGWVHERDLRDEVKDQNEYENVGDVEKGKCGKDIYKPIINVDEL
ncbi:MAG: hypothetical protein EZS28_047182, partial [Streblomastix strix]